VAHEFSGQVIFYQSYRAYCALIEVMYDFFTLLLDVHGLLQKEEIQGVALHSQMNQTKRETQLNIFRSGKCPILLATDVAARGIHIKNVEYVINYDFPGSLEQVC